MYPLPCGRMEKLLQSIALNMLPRKDTAPMTIDYAPIPNAGHVHRMAQLRGKD
jgi:hypothetical protein